LPPLSIVDMGTYLPANEVGLDFFFADAPVPLGRSPLLRPPEVRRHVQRSERASEMIERAARPIFERLGLDPEGNVDLLITNVLLPDIPITGSGAEAAALLGCSPPWIIDLHNGGCGSFPYMMKLAQAIVDAGEARTAVLCNVQNAAGQVFSQTEIRQRGHALTAGDACAVTYLRAGEGSTILGVAVRNAPASARDMGLDLPDGRKYWEAGESQIDIHFDEANAEAIVERGNRLVPAVVRDVLEKIGATPHDIDVLVTNQPNRIFLRNWRQDLGVPAERHLDTFDELGNLYGAGAPVTLAHAMRAGRVQPGDLVVVAGFAHAGDFAAAAAIRWGGAP
jgi:3-oxoacyl-[acyl-carrier-protein] synthase III